MESFKKKTRHAAVGTTREQTGESVGVLCEMVGMSRQNYYKVHRCRRRREVDEGLVVQMVRMERHAQPRLGGRKLHVLLREEWQDAGVEMGRDRLFEVLRRHELLLERKARSVRTTDSGHGLRVYGNLVKDCSVTACHQVWVSDITYLRTDEGFLYLSLVMDAYSRVIVGYDCSDSLESVGALRSLSMALEQLPSGMKAIHHSDRGCQYCCGAYIRRLKSAGLAISMTEENHCYENGQAERLNGILKQEYGLGETLRCKSDALSAVREAVYLYNHRRPHQALGYAIPMRVHQAA